MLLDLLLLGLGSLIGLGVGLKFGRRTVYYRNDFNLVFGACRKLEAKFRAQYPNDPETIGLLLKKHPLKQKSLRHSVKFLLLVRNKMAHQDGFDQLPTETRKKLEHHLDTLKRAGLL